MSHENKGITRERNLLVQICRRIKNPNADGSLFGRVASRTNCPDKRRASHRSRILTHICRRIKNLTPMVHSSAVLRPGQIVRTKEEHHIGAESSRTFAGG